MKGLLPGICVANGVSDIGRNVGIDQREYTDSKNENIDYIPFMCGFGISKENG